MDKQCGIYCIENLINHKKYIGQSTNIKKRVNKHKSCLRNNQHNNQHLQYAWNLYGEDNFIFYIIEECLESELDNREIYYIESLNLRDDKFGYNIELGGFKNKHMSDKTKKKISDALSGRKLPEEQVEKIASSNRGKKRSEESKRRMSENHADVSGENNPNYGKHMSEETKHKMIANRNTRKGKDHPNYGKPLSCETKEKLSKIRKGMHAGSKHPRCRSVYCPELNQTFWGAAEVEEIYGIDRTYISACLSGRQKSAGKHPVTGEKLHWLDANGIKVNA